jgi:hypothetical protein
MSASALAATITASAFVASGTRGRRGFLGERDGTLGAAGVTQAVRDQVVLVGPPRHPAIGLSSERFAVPLEMVQGHPEHLADGGRAWRERFGLHGLGGRPARVAPVQELDGALQARDRRLGLARPRRAA